MLHHTNSHLLGYHGQNAEKLCNERTLLIFDILTRKKKEKVVLIETEFHSF